ncbi:MAG TPA: zf-HC2 domain-containing protein [Pyrinomonadaceae bacterium]|nr:zf-HC2 domain-containing protein [Pyrinomonadaceae bacterium]
MNYRTDSPECERSSDLMAFLYDEMNERESREFASHLQSCSNCRDEAASFGQVRQSIVAWRDDVLTGFVPATTTPARRSAIAAFKQFFDLSPLWLKGAAAFAVLTFCALVALAFVNFKKPETVVTTNNGGGYTQQDVDRLVKEALAKQQAPVERGPNVAVTVPASSKKSVNKQQSTNRRPLSPAEREQLAADLRLLPTDDELDLTSDRINHEEK